MGTSLIQYVDTGAERFKKYKVSVFVFGSTNNIQSCPSFIMARLLLLQTK